MQPGKTRLVMLESPTNPRMGICDLKALCEIARQVLPHCPLCTLLLCMQASTSCNDCARLDPSVVRLRLLVGGMPSHATAQQPTSPWFTYHLAA